MSHHDDLHQDLQPVIDLLAAHRPEATALELDAVKQQVRARVAAPARRRTRRNQVMKSRLVILTMLVLGMLLSTAGAGLAVSGLDGGNASNVQYAKPSPSGGGVLGDQDTGSGTQPTNNGGSSPNNTTNTQPSRQVEAGANNNSLPFTGFAAIPVLLGGIALLSIGLVLRRRTGDER